MMAAACWRNGVRCPHLPGVGLAVGVAFCAALDRRQPAATDHASWLVPAPLGKGLESGAPGPPGPTCRS
jgi:hypothetical protein